VAVCSYCWGKGHLSARCVKKAEDMRTENANEAEKWGLGFQPHAFLGYERRAQGQWGRANQGMPRAFQPLRGGVQGDRGGRQGVGYQRGGVGQDGRYRSKN
jgi:hypothetical protein